MKENIWTKYDFYSAADFRPHALEFLRKRGKNGYEIAETWTDADTETAWNHDEEAPVGWVYQWAFLYDDRQIVYGRRPSEFCSAMKKIARVNKLSSGNEDRRADRIMICYIHNLAYDFQYLKEFLRAEFGERGKILAVKEHKIITFLIAGIEFRCSYKLSGDSLEKWGNDLNIKHKKLVGTIDYDVIRYPDTPLNRKDWLYMFRDVISMHECIETQLKINGDNIKSVPLTMTGYVRRDCRAHFKKAFNKNRRNFLTCALTRELYEFCQREKAGGITHGNRFLAGKLVKGRIKHRDFESHYPSKQRVERMPTGKFFEYFTGDSGECSIGEILEKANMYGFLIAISLTDVKIKKGVTLPYIQACKAFEGKEGPLELYNDNGRVLFADGTFTLYVTELDLKWIARQYTFSYEILKAYAARKSPVPVWLRDTVDNFYFQKCNLKEKIKTEGETPDLLRRYATSKKRVNGIFGMSMTDPVRDEYDETEGGIWVRERKNGEEVSEALAEYYKNYNSFMPFQLGLWTTATARDTLMTFVELIGYDRFIYADTDSEFYFTDDETERKIEAYNKELIAASEAMGAYIDTEGGKRHYYNHFDDEKEEITEFKFLHAKCYGYNTSDGRLHLTIAGVSKKGKGVTREKELAELDNLKDGFVFKKCGGTRVIYTEGAPRIERVNGHDVETAAAACITDRDLTLNEIFYDEHKEIIEWSVEE